MADTGASEQNKLKVFVSYSREDLAFADELVAGLDFHGFDVTIDRHSIAAGENFQTRLGGLILAADTIVFVLSPASLASDSCAWEVDESLRLSKRILPVLARAVDFTVAPEKLKFINAIPFTAGKVISGLNALVVALDSDLDWLRRHTQIGEQADEWAKSGRADDRLLRGATLIEAKAWLAARPRTAPEPTEVQRAFIAASEDAETARADAARRQIKEMQAAQQQREAALKQLEGALKEAEAAQNERAEVLARLETALKFAARFQRRQSWALASIAAVVLAFFANTYFQQRELAHREMNIFTSLAATAMNDDRHERAMRFALQAFPPMGALPWSPFSTELEGRLAAAAMLTTQRLTMRGHADDVRIASFSPAGRRIVTASLDAKAIVHDAETGHILAELKGHTHRITSASFSPDGKQILTLSDDETARVWDAESGRELVVTEALPDYGFFPSALRFSPDGKLTATVAKDNTAKIWEVSTGKVIRGLPHNRVLLASFSRNGKHVLTASIAAVRVWDAFTGDEISVFQVGQDSITGRIAASFSPNGEQVVIASDSGASVWNAATGEKLKVLDPGGAVFAASFSPDGTRVVTARFDQTATVWNAETGRQIARLEGDNVRISYASFSPNGRQIVTAPGYQFGSLGQDYDVARVWNAETGKQFGVLRGHTDWVRSAAFSPDGKHIVTGSLDRTARLWSVGQKEIAILGNGNEQVQHAQFSADDKRVVTVSGGYNVSIWDLATSQQISSLKRDRSSGAISSVLLNPDGRWLLVISDGSPSVAQVWDAISGDLKSTLQGYLGGKQGGSFSPGVKFSADGNKVIIESGSEAARVWDIQSGKEVEVAKYASDRLPDPSSPYENVETVLIGRGTELLRDARTGREIGVVNPGSLSASLSPDGRRLAISAGEGGTVRIWDAQAGKEIGHIKDLKGVRFVRFDHTGRRVLALADDAARIWDTSWMTVYGATLRERICAEKLVGAQAFTDEELTDPILRGIDPKDEIARNPCLRRGPLSWEYWALLPGQVFRSLTALLHRTNSLVPLTQLNPLIRL